MPMPFTRPMNVTQTPVVQGDLARGESPGVALPPSNGVQLPHGQGTVHTVKDPAHQIPTPRKASAVT